MDLKLQPGIGNLPNKDTFLGSVSADKLLVPVDIGKTVPGADGKHRGAAQRHLRRRGRSSQ